MNLWEGVIAQQRQSVSVSVFPGNDLYLVSLFIWIVILNIFSEDLKEICVGMVQMVSCVSLSLKYSLTPLKLFSGHYIENKLN